MSVTKPLMNRARRSSDSFEEFDLNLKSQVQHVVQYEYRKLWWKNQVNHRFLKLISKNKISGA